MFVLRQRSSHDELNLIDRTSWASRARLPACFVGHEWKGMGFFGHATC